MGCSANCKGQDHFMPRHDIRIILSPLSDTTYSMSQENPGHKLCTRKDMATLTYTDAEYSEWQSQCCLTWRTPSHGPYPCYSRSQTYPKRTRTMVGVDTECHRSFRYYSICGHHQEAKIRHSQDTEVLSRHSSRHAIYGEQELLTHHEYQARLAHGSHVSMNGAKTNANV